MDGFAWHRGDLLSSDLGRTEIAAARGASSGDGTSRSDRSQTEGAAMSASVDRFDERARREADRFGETIVHRGELLRHPVYTRVLHWAVAIFFILSLISGF